MRTALLILLAAVLGGCATASDALRGSLRGRDAAFHEAARDMMLDD